MLRTPRRRLQRMLALWAPRARRLVLLRVDSEGAAMACGPERREGPWERLGDGSLSARPWRATHEGVGLCGTLSLGRYRRGPLKVPAALTSTGIVLY